MRLHRSGREYASFPVNVPASVGLDVSFDRGTVWVRADRPSDSTARVLVAGPDATANPAGTVVLQLGPNDALFRLQASPESVIRSAPGTVFVL